MKPITLAGGLAATLAFAVIAHAQTQINDRIRATPRATPVLPSRDSVRVNPDGPRATLPITPDVVGLSIPEANTELSKVRLSWKIVYVETVDDSVAYNHVGATVPGAGVAVSDGIVILQIPRPAARMYTGALSVTDFMRRDGFDLDQGRYEQILRGADMVLIEDKTSIPHFDPNTGKDYYTTKGLFVQPSDGAMFALSRSVTLKDDEPGALGSASNYFGCTVALSQGRSEYLNLPEAGFYGQDLIFCVRTSSRQIAVVQFRKNDIACCGKENYKFYMAVYPTQVNQRVRKQISVMPKLRIQQ